MSAVEALGMATFLFLTVFDPLTAATAVRSQDQVDLHYRFKESGGFSIRGIGERDFFRGFRLAGGVPTRGL